MSIKVGVLGAGGRMGHALLAAIAADSRLVLAGAAERAGHPAVGSRLPGGLTVCSNASAIAHNCAVLIDFTVPDALSDHLEAACANGCAIIVGTTGLEARHQLQLDRAAQTVAVLQSANTSLGVTLLAALVEQAAARLGPDWDIEILELHHRHKVDAPSGTALMLGEAAARGRGIALAGHSERGRDGANAPRREGAIGFASLRGGSAAGDHLVLFAGPGERVELGHRAEGREVFARGAVRAAAWLAGQPAGRYTMQDVLGL